MEEKIQRRLESMNNQEQDELKNMWKAFGMETNLGKKFYNMYNKKSKNNTKINYPKLKKRKNQEKENIQKNQKKKNKHKKKKKKNKH